MADDENLQGRTEAELTSLIERATAELAGRGTTQAFTAMVSLSAYVGAQVGEAARRVAETNSWSQVAAVSGTTKQAAWARWH